jgi:hypothetical protein
MPCSAGAEPALHKFNAHLSATAMQSDNGAKAQVQNSAAKMSEQQAIYELGVDGGYSNDWALLSAGYDLSQQAYSENSQPDYTRLVGNLQLDLGNNYYPLQLKIAQTNESLLNSPDAVDISANRDERAIFTLQPSLRWRATAADSVSASVRATQVSYDLHTQKDSSIRALDVVWQRSISKINSLNLRLASSETEFELSPRYDYTLESAAITYSTRLRYLTYSAAVGANKVTQAAHNLAFTKPNYDLAVSYQNVFNRLSLNLNRAVSDSSSGSGSMFGSATETSNDIDIIDVTAITLAWSSDRLCEKCQVNIYAGNSKENYQALLDDAVVKSLGANVSYRVLRNGNVAARFSANEREFEAGSASNSFNYKSYELGYNHQFLAQLATHVFVRKLQRDSALGRSKYNENIAGLTLTYSF